MDEPDGSHTLSFLIGHDDATEMIYFVNVTLSPFDVDALEFSFAIVEADTVTLRTRLFTSGKHTRGIFSSEERYLILQVVLAATVELLDWKRPQKVYRCTSDRDPPHKALKKHYLLAWAFQSAGYSLTEADPWYGQRIWWAERINTLFQPPEDC
ncbi:hypothetical protein [Belnapia sp. F-4-1]|uniref:hypothetical protein n=1 Tax=Belnapia sp. F-4-1 TaxID=1545443 RepID=UPI0011867C1B|nr:hypothetical protein [Belnapia sp. F-4-1]